MDDESKLRPFTVGATHVHVSSIIRFQSKKVLVPQILIDQQHMNASVRETFFCDGPYAAKSFLHITFATSRGHTARRFATVSHGVKGGGDFLDPDFRILKV